MRPLRQRKAVQSRCSRKADSPLRRVPRNGDAAEEPREKTGRRVLAGAYLILRVHGMPPPSRGGANAVVKSLKGCAIGRCHIK